MRELLFDRDGARLSSRQLFRRIPVSACGINEELRVGGDGRHRGARGGLTRLAFSSAAACRVVNRSSTISRTISRRSAASSTSTHNFVCPSAAREVRQPNGGCPPGQYPSSATLRRPAVVRSTI